LGQTAIMTSDAINPVVGSAPARRRPSGPEGDCGAVYGVATAGETPLRIPVGNKEAELPLGARYRAGGWYAPPGVDLAGFRERG